MQTATEDLYILGAGGHAKEVAFLVEDINKASESPVWHIQGYIDATSEDTGKYNGKYRVIGGEDLLVGLDRVVSVAVGIGTPAIVRKVYEKMQGFNHLCFPNLVHPGVVMDKERVQLGRGNIICAGNVFTTDIEVGSFNLFNRSGTYGHDMVVGNCCVLNPGLSISGGVSVGDGCLVGAGATVLQNRSLGTEAVVGAGAVVTEDVKQNATVVGVPAKPL